MGSEPEAMRGNSVFTHQLQTEAAQCNAPINVNPVGESAGKGRGFDAWDYPRYRAFDRAK